jgi:hypothetical protein
VTPLRRGEIYLLHFLLIPSFVKEDEGGFVFFRHSDRSARGIRAAFVGVSERILGNGSEWIITLTHTLF